MVRAPLPRPAPKPIASRQRHTELFEITREFRPGNASQGCRQRLGLGQRGTGAFAFARAGFYGAAKAQQPSQFLAVVDLAQERLARAQRHPALRSFVPPAQEASDTAEDHALDAPVASFAGMGEREIVLHARLVQLPLLDQEQSEAAAHDALVAAIADLVGDGERRFVVVARLRARP